VGSGAENTYNISEMMQDRTKVTIQGLPEI